MITYAEAQCLPAARQQFLDQLKATFSDNTIKCIVYVPSSEVLRTVCDRYLPTPLEEDAIEAFLQADAFVPAEYSMLGKSIPQPIFTNDTAFEHDALSFFNMLQHEHKHVTDFYHGMHIDAHLCLNAETVEFMQEGTFQAVSETRAYMHQLERARELGLEDSDLTTASITQFMLHYCQLARMPTITGFEEEVRIAHQDRCNRWFYRVSGASSIEAFMKHHGLRFHYEYA